MRLEDIDPKIAKTEAFRDNRKVVIDAYNLISKTYIPLSTREIRFCIDKTIEETKLDKSLVEAILASYWKEQLK